VMNRMHHKASAAGVSKQSAGGCPVKFR